jgi:hypothetical protein
VRVGGCFATGKKAAHLSNLNHLSRRWRKMLVLLLTLGAVISFAAAESATVTAQQSPLLLSAAMPFRNASWEEHLATPYIGRIWWPPQEILGEEAQARTSLSRA